MTDDRVIYGRVTLPPKDRTLVEYRYTSDGAWKGPRPAKDLWYGDHLSSRVYNWRYADQALPRPPSHGPQAPCGGRVPSDRLAPLLEALGELRLSDVISAPPQLQAVARAYLGWANKED